MLYEEMVKVIDKMESHKITSRQLQFYLVNILRWQVMNSIIHDTGEVMHDLAVFLSIIFDWASSRNTTITIDNLWLINMWNSYVLQLRKKENISSQGDADQTVNYQPCGCGKMHKMYIPVEELADRFCKYFSDDKFNNVIQGTPHIMIGVLDTVEFINTFHE